jgi:hypothetical protein
LDCASRVNDCDVDEISERVARNQSAFRDANERIEGAADAMLDLDRLPLLCECSNPRCTEILHLARDDYERIRSSPATFWVVPGHEVTSVDGVEVARMVERNAEYSVLEKINDAGELAASLDPRSEA